MEKNESKKINDLILLVSIGSILGGFGLFGYQIYLWLQIGEWIGYSLLWPFSYIAGLQWWVNYPDKWIGVHKLLDIIPFSLFLIIFGLVFFCISNFIQEIMSGK